LQLADFQRIGHQALHTGDLHAVLQLDQDGIALGDRSPGSAPPANRPRLSSACRTLPLRQSWRKPNTSNKRGLAGTVGADHHQKSVEGLSKVNVAETP
jgi:hypothetical protein